MIILLVCYKHLFERYFSKYQISKLDSTQESLATIVAKDKPILTKPGGFCKQVSIPTLGKSIV